MLWWLLGGLGFMLLGLGQVKKNYLQLSQQLWLYHDFLANLAQKYTRLKWANMWLYAHDVGKTVRVQVLWFSCDWHILLFPGEISGLALWISVATSQQDSQSRLCNDWHFNLSWFTSDPESQTGRTLILKAEPDFLHQHSFNTDCCSWGWSCIQFYKIKKWLL